MAFTTIQHRKRTVKNYETDLANAKSYSRPPVC